MKNLGLFITTLFILAGLIATQPVYAQKDKKDKGKKETKSNDKKDKDKGKKGNKPSKEEKKALKAIKKNPKAAKAQIDNLTNQLGNARTTNMLLQEENNKLKKQVDSLSQLSAEIQRLRDEISQKDKVIQDKANEIAELKRTIPAGRVYRVQIGAFVKFKPSADPLFAQQFMSESKDEMNRYTIGMFREEDNAELFRQDIMKMGIKDAWIVAYNDGIRDESFKPKHGPAAPRKKTANNSNTNVKKKDNVVDFNNNTDIFNTEDKKKRMM